MGEKIQYRFPLGKNKILYGGDKVQVWTRYLVFSILLALLTSAEALAKGSGGGGSIIGIIAGIGVTSGAIYYGVKGTTFTKRSRRD